MTGPRRKRGDALSRGVLMGRAAWPPPAHATDSRRVGVEGAAPCDALRMLHGPSAVSGTPWLVALAGQKHPFPSRTRPLRARAAMILRPGARESSAPPTSISNPCTARAAQGFFFARPLAARQDASFPGAPGFAGLSARPLAARQDGGSQPGCHATMFLQSWPPRCAGNNVPANLTAQMCGNIGVCPRIVLPSS